LNYISLIESSLPNVLLYVIYQAYLNLNHFSSVVAVKFNGMSVVANSFLDVLAATDWGELKMHQVEAGLGDHHVDSRLLEAGLNKF
jgi:hypothetical protein